MKNIHIENSYKVWARYRMEYLIDKKCLEEYNSHFPTMQLNRLYSSMFIEWWLRNIGYYITRPFCFIRFIKKINLRCKDVDLEEWK